MITNVKNPNIIEDLSQFGRVQTLTKKENALHLYIRNVTSCMRVYSTLKKHLPEYDKLYTGTYANKNLELILIKKP